MAIFCDKSESVILNCGYVLSDHGYICNVLNAELITSRDDCEITEVRGQHEDGKTDDDVTGFIAYDKTIYFIPRGLTKFFKNIRDLTIISSNLQIITIDDLKEFRYQLKLLSLPDNQIYYIENGVLSGLEKLETLNLQLNPCTSEEELANDDRTNVFEIIRRVEENCKFATTTSEPIIPNKNPKITESYSKYVFRALAVILVVIVILVIKIINKK